MSVEGPWICRQKNIDWYWVYRVYLVLISHPLPKLFIAHFVVLDVLSGTSPSASLASSCSHATAKCPGVGWGSLLASVDGRSNGSGSGCGSG